MKTNRFAPTSLASKLARSASLRIVGGLACAAIAAVGGTGTASASNAAPANAPTAAAPAPSPQTIATFSLTPNAKFLPCMAQYPNDASRQPQIDVSVVRDSQERPVLSARTEHHART